MNIFQLSHLTKLMIPFNVKRRISWKLCTHVYNYWPTELLFWRVSLLFFKLCVCVCICVCPGCCLFWLNNFRKTQVNHTLPVFQLVAFSLEPKWVDPLCSIPGYTGVHTFYTGVTNRANHTLVIPFLFPLCLRQCCLARLHCLHVSRRLHPQQLHQEGPDGGTQAHLRPQRLQL